MNELQIFNSEEFGDIRTVTIDNEPWFVGKDVATALGYKNTADAIGKHIDTDDKLTSQIAIAGQRRDVVVINESGVYALIFGSKLDSAKRFKHWVTSEVLPTIRKTGSYQKPMTVAEQIQLLAQGNQDHEERIEKLESTMTIDYGQQKYLSDLVSRVVIEALGGKKSNAYDEIGKKVFAECNRDVKTYFDVNARNNIPKLRYQEAVEYIKEWTPCANTKIMIRDCNAQITMQEMTEQEVRQIGKTVIKFKNRDFIELPEEIYDLLELSYNGGYECSWEENGAVQKVTFKWEDVLYIKKISMQSTREG